MQLYLHKLNEEEGEEEEGEEEEIEQEPAFFLRICLFFWVRGFPIQGQYRWPRQSLAQRICIRNSLVASGINSTQTSLSWKQNFNGSRHKNYGMMGFRWPQRVLEPGKSMPIGLSPHASFRLPVCFILPSREWEIGHRYLRTYSFTGSPTQKEKVSCPQTPDPKAQERALVCSAYIPFRVGQDWPSLTHLPNPQPIAVQWGGGA